MPQVINTNIASLNAQRNLNTSQSALQTSLQRLSSGLRINSAKDDAAGLAISERMAAQIRSLDQGARNANDGISMIQTAEGALDQVQTMMQRMRELATQAASDTVGASDRGSINTEMQQLLTEMNNIGNRTKFNGNNLLTGALATSLSATSAVGVGTVVVAGTDTSITGIDVSGAKASDTLTLAAGTGASDVKLTNGAGVSQTVTIGSAIAANGSYTLNFDQLGVKITVGSVSGDTAANVAAGLAGAGVISTAAGNASATLQIGADYNASNQVQLSFADMRVTTTNADAGLSGLRTALDSFNTTQSDANAGALLSAVDTALNSVSNQRATFGAAQNRLNYAVANIQAQSENLSSAKSRITDADFAAETANLTRNQILQQAGMAMLAQANAMPQNVLTLLKG